MFFVSGLLNEISMVANIPADMAQLYGFTLKLAQKISYIYDYEDLITSNGELIKEAIGIKTSEDGTFIP